MQVQPLRRILGTPTAWLIGMGVAIGSGILRTPGDVAAAAREPRFVVALWLLGGVVVLMQGLVTAELATRHPQAGGEYVYLRRAYGDFAAFFFGWAYTVFIIGAGAAAIAAALGDFSCDLFGLEAGRWSGPIAAAAVALVTAVNAASLRAGAGVQNALTLLKTAALLGIIAAGFAAGRQPLTWTGAAGGVFDAPPRSGAAWFFAALLPVLWAYDGTTDSVKMAEEIRDVRRALPRAIVGSTLSLTLLYLLVNVSLLRVVPVGEMEGLTSAPAEAMSRLFGPAGRAAMNAAAIVICLGSLSATTLATIRVTFALARDGLTFRFMAGMSAGQAPVPALLVVGAFAAALVLLRPFAGILNIYFFASAILFGLSYASLLVFRLRERTFPDSAFRCPFGVAMAAALVLIQLALAAHIAWADVQDPERHDILYALALLGVLGALYLVWKRAAPASPDD